MRCEHRKIPIRNDDLSRFRFFHLNRRDSYPSANNAGSKQHAMQSPNDKQTPDAELAEDVKAAMSQAAKLSGGTDKIKHPQPKQSLYWHIIVVAILLLVVSVYFISGHDAFGISQEYAPLANHVSAALLIIALILAAQKTIDFIVVRRLRDNNIVLFNLRLIIRLFAAILVGLVFLSAISQTWYTVPIFLGLFSVSVGFGLQTPLTSFVGWIYILVRKPYRVGDRVKIAGATGDVIDVSYFDTTLWEFGGQYLSTDHPSGRIIKFPNSTVLNLPVYNYSWPLFPYIWDEIKFNVAYDSDLDFVASVMTKITKEEVGEVMAERVRAYRTVLDKTPVDQLEVREEPTVFFRVNENAWLDAIVRYLVDPKEAGRIKTVLIRKMLLGLNAEPDRVLFPKWR
jgi:small-conductance mechanosensitive channel